MYSIVVIHWLHKVVWLEKVEIFFWYYLLSDLTMCPREIEPIIVMNEGIFHPSNIVLH